MATETQSDAQETGQEGTRIQTAVPTQVQAALQDVAHLVKNNLAYCEGCGNGGGCLCDNRR